MAFQLSALIRDLRRSDAHGLQVGQGYEVVGPRGADDPEYAGLHSQLGGDACLQLGRLAGLLYGVVHEGGGLGGGD